MINKKKLLYDIAHKPKCYMQEGAVRKTFMDFSDVIETIKSQPTIERYSIAQVVEAIKEAGVDIVEAIQFRDWDMLTDLLTDFIGGAQ